MNPYCAKQFRAARSHTAGDTGSTSRSGDEKNGVPGQQRGVVRLDRTHLVFHADQIAYCQALTTRQQIGDPRPDLGTETEIGGLLDQLDDRVGVQKDHQ